MRQTLIVAALLAVFGTITARAQDVGGVVDGTALDASLAQLQQVGEQLKGLPTIGSSCKPGENQRGWEARPLGGHVLLCNESTAWKWVDSGRPTCAALTDCP